MICVVNLPALILLNYVCIIVVIRCVCVYDEHQELVGIPPKSWSEYTMTQQARDGQNIQPMTKLEKLIM